MAKLKQWSGRRGRAIVSGAGPGKDIWDRGGLGERCGAGARGHCVGAVDLEAVLGGWGSALASRGWRRRRLARSPAGGQAGGRGSGVRLRGRDGASRGPR